MREHGAARRGCARGLGLPACPPAGLRLWRTARAHGCARSGRTGGAGLYIQVHVVRARHRDLGEKVCGSRRSRLRSVREAQALRLNSGVPPTGVGVFPRALARPSQRGPSVCLSVVSSPGTTLYSTVAKVLASLPFFRPLYETGHYSKLRLRLLSA